MTFPNLPNKLITCLPPWCECSNDKANAPESEPVPTPFCLTVPHSIRRQSYLWDVLGNTDDLNDHALKERILPICREIQYFQEHDRGQLYGLSKKLVVKYGETAMRVIRRVWDLHLAYTSAPEIPGGDPGVFDQSTWLTAIRDVYAEDFKVANHDQVKKGVYITDVLVQERMDRIKRAEKEREVFAGMLEELTREPLEELPGFKATALGEAPLSSLRRCVSTADRFYELADEKEDILENGDESDMRYYQALQLWHVAARAAMSWEPRRVGTLQGVLKMYCDDILSRRKREKLARNAELREQLEAILGDTRGDQAGFGSEAEEGEESDEDEHGDGENDEDEDEDGDSSEDEDRPLFGHCNN
ncbi:hypothetical protein F66182_8873 [Fusarium sp. NRRL 66182]|nr:hypothetical protein F66182_8873 [Fusarium sp. NRRL 66182]